MRNWLSFFQVYDISSSQPRLLTVCACTQMCRYCHCVNVCVNTPLFSYYMYCVIVIVRIRSCAVIVIS